MILSFNNVKFWLVILHQLCAPITRLRAQNSFGTTYLLLKKIMLWPWLPENWMVTYIHCICTSFANQVVINILTREPDLNPAQIFYRTEISTTISLIFNWERIMMNPIKLYNKRLINTWHLEHDNGVVYKSTGSWKTTKPVIKSCNSLEI